MNISLNSSKNWNKAGNQQYMPTRGDLLAGASGKILKKGYSVTGFWSYSFAGLSPEDVYKRQKETVTFPLIFFPFNSLG